MEPIRVPRRALAPLALLFLAPALPHPRPLPHADFVSVWEGLYPESSSADVLANTPMGTCSLCHKTSHTWNGYGWQMLLAMEGGSSPTEALRQIEAMNSDGDPTGASNLAEIRADAQPGWTPGASNTITYRQGVLRNQYAPDGISAHLDPPCEQVASTTVRNGSGVNPGCLTSLTPPVLGSAWRIEVDASVVPGADATLLVSHLRGVTGPQFDVGEILIDLSSPRVFVLAQPVGAGTVYTVELPAWSVLLGFSATMQGAVLIEESFARLCNAVDYTIGCRP